jgi:hypothetical protein
MEVSDELLSDLHNKAIKDFLRSKAPQKAKDIAASIQPVYKIVNRPRAYYYACAYVRNPLYTKIVGPTYRIKKTNYILIIELNKALCHRNSSKKFFENLIKHELSHLLEIILNKATDEVGSWSDEFDHAFLWQIIFDWFRNK